MIKLLTLVLLLLASPAFADSITGIPRIVDGDSLVIDGVKIRLHGIDAPERNQTCGTDPNRWDCGRPPKSAATRTNTPSRCRGRSSSRS